MILKTIKNRFILINSLLCLALISSCEDSDKYNVLSDGVDGAVPVSGFTYVIQGQDVTFTNTSVNATNYEWNFEGEALGIENSESIAIDTVFTFNETPNPAIVTLSAINTDSGLTNRFEAEIEFLDPSFIIASTVDKTVSFQNTSLSAISYLWDFGDELGSSTEENPVYEYSDFGTYIATLTATDRFGNTEIFVNEEVTVAEPGAGTFRAVILNGTADEFTKNTGDNADAWNMVPNDMVEDNDGVMVPSPYFALWFNSGLDTWLNDNCGDKDQQPGSTSDGNKFSGLGDRGLKFNEACRRLYQVITVEEGVEYTLSIDSRSEAEGVNTEVFILNNEISNENVINTSVGIATNTDGYLLIDNDFNSAKSTATTDTFTTSILEFTASTNSVVIYVRSLDAVDGDNEVFYDNITIKTKGFE